MQRQLSFVLGLTASVILSGSASHDLQAQTRKQRDAKKPPVVRKTRGETQAAKNARLIQAVRMGDSVSVVAGLREGASVNARAADGRTALMLATLHAPEGVTPSTLYLHGEPAIVASLLKQGADANLKIANGETALMMATRVSDTKIVQKLMDAKANVNAASNEGVTALMIASALRRGDVVNLLLDRGANVNAVSKNKVSALVLYMFDPAAEARRNFLGEKTPVKDENILSQLVAAGADIHGETLQFTPLMAGAQAGDVKGVKFLLDKGAKINARLANGVTALHMAALASKARVLKLLLERGADPNLMAVDDSTALMMAAHQASYTSVESLLKHGASVNEKNNAGKTALKLATEKKHTAIVALLKAAGAQE
jgi:uncharacterized protein